MSSLTQNLAEMMFSGTLKCLYLVSDAFNYDLRAFEATIKKHYQPEKDLILIDQTIWVDLCISLYCTVNCFGL